MNSDDRIVRELREQNETLRSISLIQQMNSGASRSRGSSHGVGLGPLGLAVVFLLLFGGVLYGGWETIFSWIGKFFGLLIVLVLAGIILSIMSAAKKMVRRVHRLLSGQR